MVPVRSLHVPYACHRYRGWGRAGPGPGPVRGVAAGHDRPMRHRGGGPRPPLGRARGPRLRRVGPEPLLTTNQARILGEVLSHDLRFEGQPDDEARAEIDAAMPSSSVDAFFDFYVTSTLDSSQPHPNMHNITGREPRTFRPVEPGHAGRLQAQLKGTPSYALTRDRGWIRASSLIWCTNTPQSTTKPESTTQ